MSDIALLSRRDVDVEDNVIDNGKNGCWVKPVGDGKYDLTANGDDFGYIVWNESGRDPAKQEWTPDVIQLRQVATFAGKLYAKTDQYSGTPSVGDALYVGNDGKLSATANGSDFPVAYCVAAEETFEHLGHEFTVIEIQTV